MSVWCRRIKSEPTRYFGKAQRILAMRGRFTTIMGLTLGCFATTALASECQDRLQQDKSQQNSADEAAVKGDLKAGSECATPADKALSEKKNEDAAERAKNKIDAPAGTSRRGK
jgi:hypothetical protein